jgi:16S rRNA (guanine527-N7)-methyltransferase
MDQAFEDVLRSGIAALSLPVDDAAVARLVRYADLLLTWNRKVNLTAITDPKEMAEKHFVDSLVLLPALLGSRTLLDLGSGAGLPGMAIACARGDIQVTCCDSVGKKVAFVKAAAVDLGVEVRGVQGRAAGKPEKEGLPRAEAVVSRALMEPESWAALGSKYLLPGGLLLGMLGKGVERQLLESIGVAHGLELLGVDQFELPVSKSSRAVVRWRRVVDVPRGT